MAVLGLVLDVNQHHPAVLADLEDAHVVACIAKATEGASWEDPTFAANRRSAARAGVPFGSYVFLRPGSKGSEAAEYLEYAKPRLGDLQPIIDAESLEEGVAALAARVNRCAHALEAEDYAPILYASSSVWLQMVKAVPALKRLKVWEAQYPGARRWSPALSRLRIRLRGGTVVMWQFTDHYTVNGRFYDASVLLAPLASIRIGAST